MQKNSVYLTSYPYFEKFLPLKQNVSKNYKKVVLLAPEVSSRKSGDRISYEQDFYKAIVETMESLSIDIICVKVRDSSHLKSRSMSKSIKFGNTELPVIAEEILFTDLKLPVPLK